MRLLIKKLYSDVVIPKYGSEGSAGIDICAYGEHIVPANTRKLISTGIAIQWVSLKPDNESNESNKSNESNPIDYYLRIAPRSGLSVKNSIDIGAGVIDSDYRGEIKICFINNSNADYTINSGDRIAQGILEKIKRFDTIDIVDELDDTERGVGGFGSTGK